MVNISPYSREAPCSQIFMKLAAQGEFADIIMCAKFLVNWSRRCEFWHPKIAIFLSLAVSPLQHGCTTVLHCEMSETKWTYSNIEIDHENITAWEVNFKQLKRVTYNAKQNAVLCMIVGHAEHRSPAASDNTPATYC